jgi:hypothetical protein
MGKILLPSGMCSASERACLPLPGGSSTCRMSDSDAAAAVLSAAACPILLHPVESPAHCGLMQAAFQCAWDGEAFQAKCSAWSGVAVEESQVLKALARPGDAAIGAQGVKMERTAGKFFTAPGAANLQTVSFMSLPVRWFLSLPVHDSHCGFTAFHLGCTNRLQEKEAVCLTGRFSSQCRTSSILLMSSARRANPIR